MSNGLYAKYNYFIFIFCRALADQLEGNENDHQKYREMVVNYIFVCNILA